MAPQAEAVDVIQVVDEVPTENPAEEHEDEMLPTDTPFKPIEAEEATEADSVDGPTVTFENAAETWNATCCAFGSKGNCTFCQQPIKHSDASVTIKDSSLEEEEQLAHTDCYNKDQEVKNERAIVIQTSARRALARKEYAALKAQREAEEQAAREAAEREAREKAEAEAKAAAEAEAAAAKLAEEQAAAEAEAAARKAEERAIAQQPKKKKGLFSVLFGGCGKKADRAVIIAEEPVVEEKKSTPVQESAMYPTVAEQMVPKAQD